MKATLAVYEYRHLAITSHGLLDTHELVCRQEPDWNELIRRARGWGAVGAVSSLLDAVTSHLDTPVPKWVLEALRPPKWRRDLMETLVPWNGNFFLNSRALSLVGCVAHQLNTSVYSPSSRLASERNCLPN